MPAVVQPKVILDSLERNAKDIRNYVRSQVDNWRRIPSVALEAFGRKGGSYEPFTHSKILWAASFGFWQIQLNNNGNNGIQVDCATGDVYREADFENGAESEAIITRFMHDATAFDAASLLRTLSERAKQPYDINIPDISSRKLRHQKDFQLGPVFGRRLNIEQYNSKMYRIWGDHIEIPSMY